MPKVSISVIKDWFRNGNKPPEAQFWSWLDSFFHKDDPIPQSSVENLTADLQKKADLVGGVVPENQLPFTITTSEVIAIGEIAATEDTVTLAVHSSGSNSVRLSGKIYERAFPNSFSFTPVVNYQKILIVYALAEDGLFFLAEGEEAIEAVEPELPVGALAIRRIFVDSNTQEVEQGEINTTLENRIRSLEWKTSISSINSIPYYDVSGRLMPSGITKFGVNIGIGATAASERLTVEGGIKGYYFVPRTYTIAQRDAMTDVPTGKLIFISDTSFKGYQTYVNGAWTAIGKDYTSDLNLKLDKVLAPNNIPERVINADGSTSPKGNFSRTLQVEVPSSTLAQEDWKGKLILVTASCTITIPETLSDSWGCEIATLVGATLTLAITNPKTWLFGTPSSIPEKSIITVAQRGATNSIAVYGV